MALEIGTPLMVDPPTSHGGVLLKKVLITISTAFCLLSSVTAFAQQTELEKAYPGDANTRRIDFLEIRSAKVKETLQSVDLGYEMGDGYYDVLKLELYMVFDKNGKLLGFMEAALMSYTEDPDLFLVAAFVNTKGVRLGEVHNLNSYYGYDDENLLDLPEELRPDSH